MKHPTRMRTGVLLGASLLLAAASGPDGSTAAPLAGGSLDPITIPKYVTPLVIPPAMPKSTVSAGGPKAQYDIAVRQFAQQILPGGIWDTLAGTSHGFPATTVWSYGRAQDPVPTVAPRPISETTFNYPAFTIEAISNKKTTVRWINDLVRPDGTFLPHLFAVDQTLHWANPPMDCRHHNSMARTDCEGQNPAPYTGPVPLVTHVHGAHVNPESDGYPEAWWLPDAIDIPSGYATRGGLYDQYNKANTVPGSAYYAYENDQPATTLWYHDHALGMTRLNVYAGPAGFWHIRDGANGDQQVIDASTGLQAKLPGPAAAPGKDPNFDAVYRKRIREISIAIQDRSFNADGSLFYPDNRAFFEGLNDPDAAPDQFPGAGNLEIPTIPAPDSDISPIWNPEAFFNTMVVNGTTWPSLEVAPARYRFRLLDGCNSRFLNLALFEVSGPGLDGAYGTADDTLGAELPFYQIGAEQGFLPKVVKVLTGSHTVYDGTPGGTMLARDPAQALLLGPAERADVIVDFSGLADGTRIRMINTGPDAPFGGFPVGDDLADSDTTGQVMEFLVNSGLLLKSDQKTSLPTDLILPAEAPLGPAVNTRQLSLNEEVSGTVCVTVALDGTTSAITPASGYATFDEACLAAGGVPFGPKAALLGTVETDPVSGVSSSIPLRWMEPITENPTVGDTETWEIFNLTMDAHPIHLHLVRFEVLDRQDLAMDGPDIFGEFFTLPELAVGSTATPADSVESGFKDTVIAYPGQVTRLKALFDKAGLYVWHCHIVEHEDNEMMRPYVVVHTPDINGNGCVERVDLAKLLQVVRKPDPTVADLAYDLNKDGVVDIGDARYLVANFTNPRGVPCR